MEIPKLKNEINKPGMEFLPHRAPFLFVDKMLSADETGAVGEFTYRPGEFQYLVEASDDKPPMVPGTVLIESMSQVAGAGLVARGVIGGGDNEAVFTFAAIDSARFRRPVRLGDTLVTVAKALRLRKPLGVFEVKGYVGGELAAEAVVKCMLSDRPKASKGGLS